MKRLLFLTILLSLLFSACAKLHPDSHKKKVLIIQSYNEKYHGYKRASAHIDAVFQKENRKSDYHYTYQTFYLDCENYLAEQEIDRIDHYLDSLTTVWKPDAILVFDDQATYSLLSSDNIILNEIPIVFAGVGYPNMKLIDKYRNVTGFWDKPDYVKNIRMIEDLVGPSIIRVFLDSTFIDTKIRKDIVNQLSGSEFKFFIDTHVTIPEEGLKKSIVSISRLRTMQVQYLLWMLSGSNEENVLLNTKFDFTTYNIKHITNSICLSSIQEGIGSSEGIFGGYVATGEQCIDDGLNQCFKRLEGEIIDERISLSPKCFLIDYNEYIKMGYKAKDIPSDWIVLNMPLYVKYPVLSFAIGIFVLLFILGIILMYFHKYLIYKNKEKNTNEKLTREKQYLNLALLDGNTFVWKYIPGKEKFVFSDENLKSAGYSGSNSMSFDEFTSSMSQSDIIRIKKAFERVISGKTSNYILQFKGNFINHPDLQWWEFRLSRTPDLREKGDFLLVGTLINIQQIKEEEEKLKRTIELAEKAEMKESFLANMSHEIRTPLNSIMGFTNLLTGMGSELTEEERVMYLKTINDNSVLLLKLINDILDLSRIESGYLKFEMKPININVLLSDIYNSFSMQHKEGVELRMNLSPEHIIVDTDYLRITQLINNFLTNSFKFTHSGYIEIGSILDKETNTYTLYVEDSGIGMNDEEQKLVFNRFHKNNEFAQGTGLGLAICKVIVDRLGGTITLKSEKGKGTRFETTFPLTLSVSKS